MIARASLLAVALSACATTSSSDRSLLAQARVAAASGDRVAAMTLYEQIPRNSAVWPRALFEAGREDARGHRWPRALGRMSAFRAPALATRVFPERYAIEAAIYYQACYYDRALEAVAGFRAQVRPHRDAVAAMVAA